MASAVQYSPHRIISLPSSFIVPHEWKETHYPPIEKSGFSFLSDNTLFWSRKILTVISGGLGVVTLGSIYFRYIPVAIFSFVGFCSTMILILTFENEQIRRCSSDCSEFEYWLQGLHTEIKKFKETVTPLAEKDEKSFNAELQAHKKQLVDAAKPLIERVSKDLNKELKDYCNRLEKHHNLLFGETRTYRQKTITNYWIHLLETTGFLGYFAGHMNAVAANEEPWFQLKHLFKIDFKTEPLSRNDDAKSFIMKLNVIEKIENIRMNVAAFRHSLTSR